MFPCIQKSKARANCINRGPWFGEGELSINTEPFFMEKTCRSYANAKAYKIGTDEQGFNKLTKLKEE